jgi:ribosomal protein L6P/L9E
MRLPEISRTIQVPEDVNVSLQGKVVSVKGKQGTLTRDFSFAPIEIEAEGKNVRVSAKWPRKKEAALVGTIYSHINNMITGVTKGYSYS